MLRLLTSRAWVNAETVGARRNLVNRADDGRAVTPLATIFRHTFPSVCLTLNYDDLRFTITRDVSAIRIPKNSTESFLLEMPVVRKRLGQIPPGASPASKCSR